VGEKYIPKLVLYGFLFAENRTSRFCRKRQFLALKAAKLGSSATISWSRISASSNKLARVLWYQDLLASIQSLWLFSLKAERKSK
jgi:hypothetical protein